MTRTHFVSTRKKVVEHRRQAGIALVAAAISTLILAGAVGVFHILSGDTGKLAGAQEKFASLDAFGLGVLNLCIPIIDSTLERGDFLTESILQHINTDGSMSISLNSAQYASLSGELASQNQWSDYSGNVFDPDVVVTSGQYTGFLDIDFVVDSSQKEDSSGGWGGGKATIRWEEGMHSGAAGGGGAGAAALALGDALSTYRCTVWVTRADGGSQMFTGILEK